MYNKIYCGDSVSILRKFKTATVDLVFTDPPYLCNYRDRLGRTLRNDKNASGVMPVFDEVYRVLKNNSYCISFYGWSAIDKFAAKWSEVGFRTVGHFVWRKRYVSKSGFAQYRHESAFLLAKGRPDMPAHPISDVQEWEYSGNREHPTEKAVSVLKPLIKCFSKKGDVVLDPFSGSGSTSVAAAMLGRRYIGVELEARYCKLAQRRLSALQRTQQNQAWNAFDSHDTDFQMQVA